MVDTGAGSKNIFMQVYQIMISDMHHQAYGYFGMIGIVNVGNTVLPNPLVVSALQNSSNNSQEVQTFYDSVRSNIISKSIECSIINTSMKKLRLH